MTQQTSKPGTQGATLPIMLARLHLVAFIAPVSNFECDVYCPTIGNCCANDITGGGASHKWRRCGCGAGLSSDLFSACDARRKIDRHSEKSWNFTPDRPRIDSSGEIATWQTQAKYAARVSAVIEGRYSTT